MAHFGAKAPFRTHRTSHSTAHLRYSPLHPNCAHVQMSIKSERST